LLAPGAPVAGETSVTPGSASVTALDRETGRVVWTVPIESAQPPVVAGGVVLVAGAAEIHALNAATGERLWGVPLEAGVRAPMLLRGSVLVALTTRDELLAIRTDTRDLVWRRAIGESGPVLMNADDRAVYVTTAGGRIVCVWLADGSERWARALEGRLSEPALGRDRVLVGSSTNAFWALDPESGANEWHWEGHRFGGDVMGAAVEDDMVYLATLDNVLRALNRGNGNQRWKAVITTRPVLPPRAFFGLVVLIGPPTVSTFDGKTGAAIATWSAPSEAEFQGPPLIDDTLEPFRVAMVVIMRDGRVTGVRPTAMLFKEPPAAPLTTLPGRPLLPERLPGEPAPAAPVPLPLPRP
jgi:outer membrane protein assembly factor BamB